MSLMGIFSDLVEVFFVFVERMKNLFLVNGTLVFEALALFYHFFPENTSYFA